MVKIIWPDWVNNLVAKKRNVKLDKLKSKSIEGYENLETYFQESSWFNLDSLIRWLPSIIGVGITILAGCLIYSNLSQQLLEVMPQNSTTSPMDITILNLVPLIFAIPIFIIPLIFLYNAFRNQGMV